MARTKKPTAEGKVVDPPHRYKARASFLYHQKNQNRSPRGPEGRGVPRKCDRDINTICKLGKVKEWMAAGGRAGGERRYVLVQITSYKGSYERSP
jgi:hypothetical protein